MNKKTLVEKVAGNPVTGIAANALPLVPQIIEGIGAMTTPSGIAMLSAVPFLVGTLASNRVAQRYEAALAMLNLDMAQLKIDMDNITDDQIKLSSECFAAMSSTISQEKLDFLRVSIVNSLSNSGISDGMSEALSRLVRDISASEAATAVRLSSYKAVFVMEKPDAEEREGCFMARQGTDDERDISGLVRLGLLYSTSSNWDSTRYDWSPLTTNFLALVSPTAPSVAA